MLDFLRDLHDDPQPSFVVKMVLAVSLHSPLRTQQQQNSDRKSVV